MEVILSRDVAKLGKAGTVVKVKDGFARNFLIPNKLALPITQANLKMLEQERLKKEQALEKIKKHCGLSTKILVKLAQQLQYKLK